MCRATVPTDWTGHGAARVHAQELPEARGVAGAVHHPVLGGFDRQADIGRGPLLLLSRGGGAPHVVVGHERL